MSRQDRIYRVLFLCTENSARSILAEAIANRLGKGRLRAFSAGSHPTGKVNPHALELLIDLGYETAHLCSKSWSEFTRPDLPAMDIVITVCDDAARETCPVWPGHPITAHWGCPDPAKARGSSRDIRSAFVETYHILEQRIRALVELPIETLDQSTLQRELHHIALRERAAIQAFSL